MQMQHNVVYIDYKGSCSAKQKKSKRKWFKYNTTVCISIVLLCVCSYLAIIFSPFLLLRDDPSAIAVVNRLPSDEEHGNILNTKLVGRHRLYIEKISSVNLEI